MKHPILFFVFGILCSLCSCTSDEDKALQTVKQFAEAVQNKNVDLQKELFPLSTLGSCNGVIDLNGATVKKGGDIFTVSLPGSRVFYVEKTAGKFVIEDSRNVLVESIDTNYDDSMNAMYTKALLNKRNTESTKYGIGVKSGMIKGKGIDTDVTLLKNLNSLNENNDFVKFLGQKYPDAMQGNMKTLDVKQKRIGGLYRVDVLSESGGNAGGYVAATVFNKDGRRVARNVGKIEGSATGDRQSTMILFKSDVVGEIGKIEVDYILDNLDDMDCLLYFAPLSTTDYQDFINQKK
ncbi:MAG: hypothetical protein K2L14_08435 [Duncaniella sp.]|nr:hypothetical protein [Duncaniella sp.]